MKIVLFVFLLGSCGMQEDISMDKNQSGDHVQEEIVEDSLATEPVDTIKEENKPLTFLALGDSYTIGHSVDVDLRWPVQLVNQLNNRGLVFDPPTIVATTGWTTSYLLEGIEKAELEDSYDLVSLLIGVNNQYQRKDISEFVQEFEKLLLKARLLAGQKTDHLIVLSIPDYSKTPAFINSPDAPRISDEIDQYNDIAKDICESYHVKFFNITEISRLAESDRSLTAGDSLHPSGKMYELWVREILDHVRGLYMQ